MTKINGLEIIDELPQSGHSKFVLSETNQKFNIDRPSWDEYYMDMAFIISQKSLDPNTKHGCVVVDNDHSLLSIGYNSPPRGCIDEEMPLTRPSKYNVMIHSESNAIINAARIGIPLKNSIFYITGYPCAKCFREILNVGAIKIIYGPVNSNCISEEDLTAINIMNQKWASYVEVLKMGYAVSSDERGVLLPKVKKSRIEFCKYEGNIGNILTQTQEYIKRKCSSAV